MIKEENMKDFEEFKQKAKDTVETIADKSVELYRIAEEKTKLLAKMTKLSTEITLEKGNVRKLYREIGKKYYDLHKLSPEDALTQSCAEVTISLESISAKQMEFEDLKSSLKEKEKPECQCEDKDIEVEIILDETEEIVQNEPDTSPVMQTEVNTEEATADTEDDICSPPPESQL